jgi:hypothetical protein
MVYDQHPPYSILATDRIDFPTMQRLVRFARYWDLVANSGRFGNTIKQLLGDSPFANFMAFSDWIYAHTDATHRIALDRLATLVRQWLEEERGMPHEQAAALVASDYAGGINTRSDTAKQKAAAPERQARHLAA